MPYLPTDLPFPAPSLDTAGFWAHIDAGRLMFQSCGDCGHAVHPPVPICPACHTRNRSWVAAPATGRVFSYTIVHHPAHDSVRDHLPYNVVLVEFPDLPGVRLISNLVDVAPDEVRIDLVVEPVFETAADGRQVVRFRLHPS